VARRDRNVRSDKTRAASWRGSCTHLLSWKGPEPSEGYSISEAAIRSTPSAVATGIGRSPGPRPTRGEKTYVLPRVVG
jgi:hypothetical protein